MEREEWRYFIMAHGELFATIPGVSMMRELFVVALGILTRPVLYSLLTLVEEVVRYGWTMSTVGVMKALLRGAGTEDGECITVATVKMQESSVHVRMVVRFHFKER